MLSGDVFNKIHIITIFENQVRDACSFGFSIPVTATGKGKGKGGEGGEIED